jgi:hypothetical protein
MTDRYTVLQQAVLAYDAALRAAVKRDPTRAEEYRTAEGADLDTLYERMLRAAGSEAGVVEWPSPAPCCGCRCARCAAGHETGPDAHTEACVKLAGA